jgi:hypothetical protein
LKQAEKDDRQKNKTTIAQAGMQSMIHNTSRRQKRYQLRFADNEKGDSTI